MEKQTPFPFFKEIHTETSSMKTFKIRHKNLIKIVRSGIRLLVKKLLTIDSTTLGS
jgi:hypothetical protein